MADTTAAIAGITPRNPDGGRSEAVTAKVTVALKRRLTAEADRRHLPMAALTAEILANYIAALDDAAAQNIVLN